MNWWVDAQSAAILGRYCRDASIGTRELRLSSARLFARLERLTAAVLEALSFVRPRQN
jgi:hypothetical protein